MIICAKNNNTGKLNATTYIQVVLSAKIKVDYKKTTTVSNNTKVARYHSH